MDNKVLVWMIALLCLVAVVSATGSISLTSDTITLPAYDADGVTITCVQTPSTGIATLAVNITNISVVAPDGSVSWSSNYKVATATVNLKDTQIPDTGVYTASCWALAKNSTWNATLGVTFENSSITFEVSEQSAHVAAVRNTTAASNNSKIIGGAIVLAAIGVGAYLVLKGGKKKKR